MKEKELLNSVIYNLFKKSIINFKSYLWSGFTEAFSRRDFYDFENEKFFYSKDLFEQFFLYVQNIFKKNK